MTTTTAPRAGRRTRRKLALVAATAAAAVLIAAPVAGAGKPVANGGGGGGKPSGGGSSSLALVLVDSPDDVANWSETVTFSVSTTATDRPFVSLRCTQGGTLVLSSSVGFFADYPWDQEITLSSRSWTGGDADCSARLYSTKDGVRTTTLATLAFRASA